MKGSLGGLLALFHSGDGLLAHPRDVDLYEILVKLTFDTLCPCGLRLGRMQFTATGLRKELPVLMGVEVGYETDDEVRRQSEVHGRVQLAQMGDVAALQQLCVDFRPLMRRVAKRYRGVSYEDAMQEGYLAFVRAVQAYDEARGVPFAGFAARRVHGDVRTAMRKEWRYADRTAFVREPGQDEETEGVSAWEVLSYHRWADGSAGDEWTDMEFRDLVSRSNLSSREAAGLAEVMKGLSSTEIARKMGVSAETAKTWRKRAFRKVRKALQEQD